MTENTNIYIGGNELIFTESKDGKQYGGGFSAKEIMKKSGFSPLMSVNLNNFQIGGDSEKVSDLFQNLAVPNWAIKYNMSGGEYKKIEKNNDSDDDDSDIDDDLHDKLLELVKEHDNKLKQKFKKTKKCINKNNKNITKKIKNT
jgi:hypothetical protein